MGENRKAKAKCSNIASSIFFSFSSFIPISHEQMISSFSFKKRIRVENRKCGKIKEPICFKCT